MAGPSYVHYRTSDNIVTGVFSDSRTPHAGETEVFETHPLFVPPVTRGLWERTGVSTYVLNEPAFQEVDVQFIEDLNDVVFDSFGPVVGDVLTFDGTNWTSQAPVDEKVKVSEYDTEADYLANKIFGTGSVTVTTLSDSFGVETLQIDVDESFIDHDALFNFVPNEHVDHSTVSVVEGGDDALAFDNNDLTADIGLRVDIVGTTLETVNDDDDLILIHDVSASSFGELRSMTRADFLSGVVDEKVKVTAADATSGYLEDKLVEGSFITLTTLTDSFGDQTIEISFNGVATDELVKVTSNDTTPGYLFDKLTSGLGITLTEINDGGDEDLQISLNASLDDLNDVQYDSVGPLAGDLLEYDGVNWVNVEPSSIAALNTYSFNGGIQSVGPNTTKGAQWGRSSADSGVVITEDGEITSLSVSINQPRTTGTLTAMLVINGIAQNGTGETFDIDATNTISNYLILSTPIVVSAGDTLTMQTVTSSFAPAGADATLAFWGRNT